MEVNKRRNKWVAGTLAKAKGCMMESFETPLVCKLIKNILKRILIEAHHVDRQSGSQKT